MNTYILKGKRPVKCNDSQTFRAWFQTADRHVAKSQFPGHDVEVSTVFLGMDHGFDKNDKPILFETMVFGGELDEYMYRYSSWEDAENGHYEVVKRIKRTLK